MTGRFYLWVLILCQVVGILTVAQAETDDSLRNFTWSVDRETDPILDTTNITAQLRETGVKRSLLGQGKYLVVRCRERQLDAIIVWGSWGALGFSVIDTHGSEVTARFDIGTPETETWSRSTDYNATFAPRPNEFIRLLQQHQRLAVRTHPDKGGSLTAVFDLAEAKPIVHEMIAACEE